MTALTPEKRAVAAIVGSLVADAAALPLHWIYDVNEVDKAVGGRKDPEFLTEMRCPFYQIPTGRNSCYGDQAFVLLDSLVECKGFNLEDYKKRLYAMFGPETEYEGNLGRPATKEDHPIKYPWRNGSIKVFVANYKDGKNQPSQDEMADGIAKLAPIVALYAGKPELESIIRAAIRVTQDSALAVDAAVGLSQILEQYILQGHEKSDISKIIETMPEGVRLRAKEGVESKNMRHRDAVGHFGRACAADSVIKNSLQFLSQPSDDYQSKIREAILAGGDNCSRVCYIGAVLGAQFGLDGIPKEWISKTDRGQKLIELAEKLMELRGK